ncbi:MAG: DinB family protein [Dehalococcoidia bacterium]|nr:DinB family protein [Dehalococcoidia bacterium]
MDALELLRSQIATVHSTVEQALDGLTDEQLHRRIDPATTNAIASIYTHLAEVEDSQIHSRILDKPTLLQSGWQARLGIPEERGAIWAWQAPDVALLREYAAAVHADTDAALKVITTADLDREVEGTRGPQSIGFILDRIIAEHGLQHAGEMSALKGVMGLKGLPF